MNAGASDPALGERKQQLLDLTGAFCDAHLNADYKRLCKKAIERLAKLRPSPILRGKPEIWASGIVHALGSLNFLGTTVICVGRYWLMLLEHAERSASAPNSPLKEERRPTQYAQCTHTLYGSAIFFLIEARIST